MLTTRCKNTDPPNPVKGVVVGNTILTCVCRDAKLCPKDFNKLTFDRACFKRAPYPRVAKPRDATIVTPDLKPDLTGSIAPNAEKPAVSNETSQHGE